MIPSRYFALIPAAGIGARMGMHHPKQYMRLAGKPMLLHVLDTFAALQSIAHVFIVVGAKDGYIEEMLSAAPHLSERITLLRNGGATRHASVLNGLQAMRDQVEDDDWVLVHDAARPGLTAELIGTLIQALDGDAVGGLLALRVVDTVKRSSPHGRVLSTVPRAALWAAQTPQMFRYALLCRALQQAADVTDEASAVEALGLQPKLIEGRPCNFKVTTPHDVVLAEFYLKDSDE